MLDAFFCTARCQRALLIFKPARTLYFMVDSKKYRIFFNAFFESFEFHTFPKDVIKQ